MTPCMGGTRSAASSPTAEGRRAGSTSVKASSSPEKPIRNLTHAFEALCTSEEKKVDDALVSPTGVAELENSPPPNEPDVPKLVLHSLLQRELSDALVQRVSCYSVLHDINKEATALAAQDPMYSGGEPSSKPSPLIQAVLGTTITNDTPPKIPVVAILDEEHWLLSAISDRTEQSNRLCPPTFLQAMGEKEYENPLQAVTGHARTQLWKPSRSWWECKSGKNPWIEPSQHNKRWRYLWPLIHYHKFLAKCIKKLKRNGVDVKLTVTPVAVFLREEVCAISDHLAAVSLFGSDEWMECLTHFQGWILAPEQAQEGYRAFVATLSLRSIQEPGDVQSPLLRSQIDANFLRTMVAQREQMRETKKTPVVTPRKEESRPAPGPPPTHPKSVPKQINSGVRRPRYMGWWNGTNWEPYPDNTSVQSGLSADTYPAPYGMYPYYDAQSEHWVDPYSGYYYPQYPVEQVPASPDPSTSAPATANSPYWAHLDQATLSMGLATPAKVSPCRTPGRKGKATSGTPQAAQSAAATPQAQPQGPLVRQHYYGYGYAPPSPATQFMMSPQANFVYYPEE